MTLPRMYWSSERKCSFIDGQAAVIRADGKVSPCYTLPRCQVNKHCEYALNNEDCWGNCPSCADCLYSQGIVRCP